MILVDMKCIFDY